MGMIRNSLFNVGGYLVSVIAAFLIAPITIHTLGDTRYGAWSLVAELVGYYGLLDLGIRGAVTYFVAKYSAHQSQDEVKETVASAFWVLAACGLLAFVAGVLLTIGFPYLFKTEGVDVAEVRASLMIMSALIGLSLPMGALGGALIGRERFDIATSIEATNRILTTVCYYFVLKAGGGLVALASVQAVARLVSWAFTLIACKRVLGGLFTRPQWFRMERVRTLMGYGLRNAVGGIALLVIYRLDLTVVGMFAGLGQVTFYSIGGSLVGYASSLCSQFTYVFTPRFTQLESRGRSGDVQQLYFFGMRVVGMIAAGLAAGLLVFGRDFIRLWLGPSYVTGAWSSRSDVIMVILIAANLPRMLQSITWQRLYAMARVRFLMWLNVCEAIANLVLSLLLVHRFGAAGVALGTLFPLLVSHVVVMPVYSSRAFGIPLTQLLRKGMAIPLTTGLLMALVDVACIRIAPPTTWLVFFADVTVAITIGASICIGIGLSREERKSQFAKLWRTK
jgi:O-antigen/teichoic acid export membrane protein